jgi:proteasome lid subunit RPN8/RPN11
VNQAERVDSVEIPWAVHLAVGGHARSEFPCECCGVLVGRRNGVGVVIERTVPAPNITESDPFSSYQVDWETLIKTRRELRGGPSEIVGFYHSHPDGTSRPSRRDGRFAWSGHTFLIVPVSRLEVGQVAAWYSLVGVLELVAIEPCNEARGSED